MWSEDNSYLPEFELRPGECGFNLWVRWRMFENNLYYYPDLWVAIKMETDSDYEYVGPHISAAHRQRLVELRFESGEPNGLQMLMALLPPGGRLIAYGNGMDALSAIADWWPMIMAWQQTNSQEDDVLNTIEIDS